MSASAGLHEAMLLIIRPMAMYEIYIVTLIMTLLFYFSLCGHNIRGANDIIMAAEKEVERISQKKQIS